jgi:hypothetical protein
MKNILAAFKIKKIPEKAIKLFILPVVIISFNAIYLNLNLFSQNIGDRRPSSDNKLEYMSVIGNFFCTSCPITMEYSFYGKDEVYQEVRNSGGGCGGCGSGTHYAWVTGNDIDVKIEFKLFKDNVLFSTKTITDRNTENIKKHSRGLNQFFLGDQNSRFSTGKYNITAKMLFTDNPDNKEITDNYTVLTTNDTITLTFQKLVEQTSTEIEQSIGITPDNDGTCKLSSCISPAYKCISITKARYSSRVAPQDIFISKSTLKYDNLICTFNELQEMDFPIPDLSDNANYFSSTVTDGAPNHPILDKFLENITYTWGYQLTVKCLQP